MNSTGQACDRYVMGHFRHKGLFVGPSRLTMGLAIDEPVPVCQTA